ncbi:malonate decarboxylase subunit delta [Pigmentiphaga aceris]|uniref:Malonate decarboxylase acyl carrier protein n=1 Tax=Pigmentiphaga aceris TaxID=1940612 RepID=A0A5C0B464_9BURK|nr:malonate decarboxylase subunit delta [Pigmentiphaga aceris]QEI07591.1 malonate decarboxylase subunit delta [Pigmentiphaga aceris]
MEQLDFDYTASTPPVTRTLVGVVGSGDLEVLVEPGQSGRTRIRVTTSVDGFAATWRAQLDRVFADTALPALDIEINDFGATPGVVGMRLAQALDTLADARQQSKS